MVVNEDVPAQDFGQGFQSQIACRRIAFVGRVPCIPAAAVSFGLNPRRPITSNVAHARRWPTRLIDALRVLAASHLQTVLGAGELHALHRARGHNFQDHAATANQVCRARQNLHRGHAAGQRSRKLRILRPDRMLGPDIRGNRIRRFVAVAVRVDTRRRVITDV